MVNGQDIQSSSCWQNFGMHNAFSFFHSWSWKQYQDRQWMYVRTTEAHSCNHCRRGKAINITYCECVFVALVIQHSVSMHCIKLPSVTCLAVPFFPPHHLINDTNSKNKMCVLIFSTTFVWNTSHSTEKWARYYHKCTHIFMLKYPLFLSDFNLLAPEFYI